MAGEELAQKKTKQAPLTDEQRQAKLEAERRALIGAAHSSDLDTIQKRVAWVLNHYPDARDSDLWLALHYWETFEGYDGEPITRQQLFEFTRLTSLARVRATIQNKYQLFLASPEIRKRRGTLAEEEKQKILEQAEPYPAWVVYADESGKTSGNLVVGSVWIWHPPSVITVENAVRLYRRQASYDAEFKFTAISRGNLHTYLGLLDVLRAHSDVLSFKAVSMHSAGVRVDTGIGMLYYHLLVRGVEHEDLTGRAALPRSLIVVKDAEEAGRDQLLLADIDDRLKQAAATRFDRRLRIDSLRTGDSSAEALIQVADLYAGSLNRLLEHALSDTSPKDVFARALFDALRLAPTTTETAHAFDRAVHLIL